MSKRNTITTSISVCQILIVVFLLTTMIPVYAYESTESLQQTTNDLSEDLDSLESQQKDLQQELESVLWQIQSIRQNITDTKKELSLLEGQTEAQYQSMKQHIRYMYENGSVSLLEILCSATSMADFLTRAEYVSSMNQYDRKLYEELLELRDQVAQKEQDLKKQQEALLSLQQTLNEKETLITSQIAATSAELTAYKEKLKEAQEEAAKAEEEAKQEVVPIPPEEPESPVTPETPQEPTPSEPTINTSATDIELLAALIECEAGSTDYEGMLAVGSVVVNRMKNRYYPDTLTGVIYQSGQFSPVRSGRLDEVLARGVKSSCVQAATDALNGKNNVGDCLSFRSAGSGHTGIIIGGNVFF